MSAAGLSAGCAARLRALEAAAVTTAWSALPDALPGRAVRVTLEQALQLPEVPAHVRHALWAAQAHSVSLDRALHVPAGGDVLLSEGEAGFALMALADPHRVLTPAAARSAWDAVRALPRALGGPLGADVALGAPLRAQLARVELGPPGPFKAFWARVAARARRAQDEPGRALPGLADASGLALVLDAGDVTLLRVLLTEGRGTALLGGWGARAVDVRVEEGELHVHRAPGGLRGRVREAHAALLLRPDGARAALDGWTRGSVPAAIQATGVHVPDDWSVLVTASHLLTWPGGSGVALQVRLPALDRGARPTPKFGRVTRVPAPDVPCPALPREAGDSAAGVRATRQRRPAFPPGRSPR